MMQDNRRSLVVLLCVYALTLFVLFTASVLSADFISIWTAGQYYAEGRTDLIYPPPSELFTMLAPDAWAGYLAGEHGYDGEVFPFLYPPLWAWVSAACCQAVPLGILEQAVLAVNSALIAATIWLAIRLTGTRQNPLLYVALTIPGLLLVPVATLALIQGQVQILVGFLILLAIERDRAEAPLTAGAALALAASLKLYPALFALFWLVTGRRRALLSFAVIGAGLAAASVLLAGWPLHAVFLDRIRTISDSVFVTPVSVNLDALVAQLFYDDRMAVILSPTAAEVVTGWKTMARPPLWGLLGKAGMLALVALLAWRFTRSDRDTQGSALWPLTLTLTALTLPFAWIYYFIPTAALAPALLDRLGRPAGLAVLLGGFVIAFVPFFFKYLGVMSFMFLLPEAVIAGMAVWAAGFAVALRRGESRR